MHGNKNTVDDTYRNQKDASNLQNVFGSRDHGTKNVPAEIGGQKWVRMSIETRLV